MPEIENMNDGERHVRLVLDKLLEAGWTDGLAHFDSSGITGIRWTEKGKRLAALVNEIEDDMQLGPKGLLALIAVCKTFNGE